MRFNILIIFMLIFLTGIASDDIKFRHISMSDGLSDNRINHITRDSQGFMWFSTSHGLNRYDGYGFKTYTHDPGNPHSLSSSAVFKVDEDASGLLWVEYWTGLYSCYDPWKDSFDKAGKIMSERYGIEHEFSVLYVDKDKDLWLQNDTVGTIHYSFSDRKAIYVSLNDVAAQSGQTVISFGEDKDGILRMYSNGLFDHISKSTGKIDWINNHVAASERWGNRRYNIFTDIDGDYWIWCDAGIMLYHKRENRWETIDDSECSPYRLNGYLVRSLACDSKGKVWIAIDHGGINIIDKKKHSIRYVVHDHADDNSLVRNNVVSLYADSDGGIWAGTFKSGISYYNEHMFGSHTEKFFQHSNLKDFIPDISSIAEDRDGTLYMGTPENLIHFDIGKNKTTVIAIPSEPYSLPEEEVLSLACDSVGNIWIGSYQGGLMCYDVSTSRLSRKILDNDNHDSEANKSIWSLVCDKNGYMWIGTWGKGLWGLDPLSGKVKRFYDPEGNFNNEQIACICLSDDGNLYMATPYGMLIYYPESGKYEKRLGTKDGNAFFHGTLLNHIFEDSRGLLWISSMEGLSIYDRGADSISFLGECMQKSIIHGVLEDNGGNMWISSSEGLYNAIVGVGENGYTYNLRKYRDAGIPEDQQFNLRSLLKMRSGRLAFGGIKGISIVDPSGIKEIRDPHKIVFTDLQIRNKSIEVDSLYQGNVILHSPINRSDRIELRHNQNSFSVTFSSMNYSCPGNTGYLYKLDGFDSDWIFTTENKVSYTNLDPGHYVLKIKEVDDDGAASGQISELHINIVPPFYRSWPAYILYFLIIAVAVLMVWAYFRQRESHRCRLMEIRQEADKKHEVDDLKLRFFTNISHDLRTPLTLILTPLEYISAHLDDKDLLIKVNMAYNNALRLLGMVNQLLDFRKSDLSEHKMSVAAGDIIDVVRTVCNNFSGYSEYHDVSLTFFSQEKSLYMLFDRDKIEKIMMNLLSNAFKFTPEGGRVDVSIEKCVAENITEMLEIKVADNGCGISDEYKECIFDRFFQVPFPGIKKSVTGNGIGLNLVKEFVTMHEGTVSVCDNIGKGAVFIVRIPIRYAESVNDPDNEARVVAENEISDLENSDREIDDGRNYKPKPTLLLVDDNDDFLKFMTDCLKSDYEVFGASDGRKAWDRIPDMQPDIVVSDVMMPGIDGNELCRLIKNDVRTSHILVILLTARSAEEHLLRGLEAGADDYITKPFNLNVLELRIKNLLNRRQGMHGGALDIAPSKLNITSLDEKLIAKAIQYVDKNIDRSDLSVEELSGVLGMSRVHFYKKLVSITGKTPVEFIRVMRLKRAEQLLRESQLNVSEIAYKSGFNNLNLFRKYFKAKYGILPSEFQNRYGLRKT